MPLQDSGAAKIRIRQEFCDALSGTDDVEQIREGLAARDLKVGTPLVLRLGAVPAYPGRCLLK